MSENETYADDVGPGYMEAADHSVSEGIRGYVFGFVLAVALTAASFYVVATDLIWGPAIPVALGVLAVAQIGVHLVLIVVLIIGGSLWIMASLNRNMMPNVPMHQMMQMQR
jgi:cytochrome o ubiquinol oxidase subunit IV